MIGHDFPYLDTRDLNLDWLLKNMKQVLQDWATYQQTMNQNFADLQAAVDQFETDITTAFDNLHDYVEDYFDNLDVQQEINNKLNAMKLSGELAEIMNPLIATQTAAWLAEHITNPSSPPVDTSLTVSGAAADAKVVGDHIAGLVRGLEGIETDNLINVADSFSWKQGDYSASEAYKVTQFIPISAYAGNTMYIAGEGWDTNSDYLMNVRFLDTNNTQVGLGAINLKPDLWLKTSVTVPASAVRAAVVVNTNLASIHITPDSICEQSPKIYFGSTDIKSVTDFYLHYEGLIPEPYSDKTVHVSRNLFDKNDITMDTYWTGSGTGEATGYYTADIPVKGGQRVVSNAINKDFSFYVTNVNYSTPSSRQKLTTVGYATVIGQFAYIDFTPPEDGHILLTGNTGTKSEPDMVMVLEGSYVPDDYVSYDSIGAIYIGSELIYPQKPEVITVASDGSGTFEKLKDAIDYAGNKQDVTIYVKSGTYNLISEFGAAYFEAFDADSDEASGLQIGNGMKIYFAAKAKVLANYTGDNQYVKSKFSPFNLIKNSAGFTLDGLNLECSNCRYGIHDEDVTNPAPYRNIYKNCRIKVDNSNNAAWGGRQCIGGGLGQSGTIEICDSTFESVGVANDYGIVSYHNGNGNANRAVKNELSIHGNYFEAGTVRLSYYGSHTDMSTGLVYSNSVTAEPYVTAETGSSTTVNMQMKKWNNEIRS